MGIRAGLLALLVAASLRGQEIDGYVIPDPVEECFQRGKLENTHQIGGWINPFYLRGDFDGDRKPDYAVLVEEKASGKKGIAVCLSSLHTALLLWAGKKFRWDDDGDFDAWSVFDKGPVERSPSAGEQPPPRLVGDAIHTVWKERGGGLIYWEKAGFHWYQQGD